VAELAELGVVRVTGSVRCPACRRAEELVECHGVRAFCGERWHGGLCCVCHDRYTLCPV
jgi:hypothetical protein